MRMIRLGETVLHYDDRGARDAPVIREADLDYLAASRAARTALAENYVGLPF